MRYRNRDRYIDRTGRGRIKHRCGTGRAKALRTVLKDPTTGTKFCDIETIIHFLLNVKSLLPKWTQA